MKLVKLKAPGGLQNLDVTDAVPPEPGPEDVLVRVRACSLNFRDHMLVTGNVPFADGRIPLSDGAGDVVAIGDHVHELAVGDRVVSTFWPE